MNEVLQKIFLAILVVSFIPPGCVTTSTNNRSGHIADSPRRIDFPNEGFSINRPPDDWIMIKLDTGEIASWSNKKGAFWAITSPEKILPGLIAKENKERFNEVFIKFINKAQYEKFLIAGFEKRGQNCIITDSDEQELQFNEKDFHQINLTAKCQFDERVNVRNRQKEMFLKISYYHYLKDERMIIFVFIVPEEHYGTLKPVINSLLNSLILTDKNKIDKSSTELSAEISDPAAQFYLGETKYKDFKNIDLGSYARSQSLRDARKWYKLAAEQGHPEAQFKLGLIYDDVQPPFSQDLEQAVKWYILAGNQGKVKAQSKLGEMYKTGRGVSQNYVAAIKWYTMAAYQGDISSQRNLALCYIESDADYVNAYAWLTMAAEQGSNLSRKKRDQISKEMSPEQLVKANDLISDIKTGKSTTP